MIYAVSDLHGCYDQYCRLLSRLSLAEDDRLYILGDIADRGKDGIKILLDLAGQSHVFACRGNHDQSALQFLPKAASAEGRLDREIRNMIRHTLRMSSS